MKLSGEQIETITERRRQGETWKALAKEIGVSGQALRRKIECLVGEVKLYPKKCKYCGDMFVPARDECQHCGKPDCFVAHKKTWNHYNEKRAKRQEPRKGEVLVECIGRFCGQQAFYTPLVNDHGRKRPLYRICPVCRERNHEYCTAWGAY